MKKLLAILTALLLAASVAYSLDSMKDADMESVTGQSGVTLTSWGGSITVTQSLQALSWGDDDGELTYGAPAPGHLAIHALELDGVTAASMGMTIGLGMTTKIDVDSSGLFLGMGSINITVASAPCMQISVSAGLALDPNVDANDSGSTLGYLATKDLAITVLMPTTLQIAPH